MGFPTTFFIFICAAHEEVGEVFCPGVFHSNIARSLYSNFGRLFAGKLFLRICKHQEFVVLGFIRNPKAFFSVQHNEYFTYWIRFYFFFKNNFRSEVAGPLSEHESTLPNGVVIALQHNFFSINMPVRGISLFIVLFVVIEVASRTYLLGELFQHSWELKSFLPSFFF